MSSFDLKKFPWSLMTREERYFCAHLFYLIRQEPDKFTDWFVEKYNKQNQDNKIDEGKKWEIGYEVCFYRDYIHWFKFNERTIGKTGFSPKRTFDLAMISEDEIIIFEAKSHEIFDQDQVDEIYADKGTLDEAKYESLHKLLGKKVKVKAIAIAPSKYFDYARKFNKENWLNKDGFDGKLTWKELSDLYDSDKVLLQAELIRYTKSIDELKLLLNG